MVADDGRDVQSQILRVHLRSKVVRYALLSSGSNLNSITHSGQVANELRSSWLNSPQTPSSEVDVDWFGLVIAEGEDGLRWFAVDKLYAKERLRR